MTPSNIDHWQPRRRPPRRSRRHCRCPTSRRSPSCRSRTCRVTPTRSISLMAWPRTSSPRCRDWLAFRDRAQFDLRLQGKIVDVRQVTRELGVRYVLEGSVRKAGNRVRITAQLIDGATGNHIWADRYDRQVVDIFEVQDDITRNVVGAIGPQLYASEIQRVQSRPPESHDAWGCVIRGLWHLGRFTKDDTEQARQLLRQAVALSPSYAKARSVLAFAEARTVIDTALLQRASAHRPLGHWTMMTPGAIFHPGTSNASRADMTTPSPGIVGRSS